MHFKAINSRDISTIVTISRWDFVGTNFWQKVTIVCDTYSFQLCEFSNNNLLGVKIENWNVSLLRRQDIESCVVWWLCRNKFQIFQLEFCVIGFSQWCFFLAIYVLGCNRMLLIYQTNQSEHYFWEDVLMSDLCNWGAGLRLDGCSRLQNNLLRGVRWGMYNEKISSKLLSDQKKHTNLYNKIRKITNGWERYIFSVQPCKNIQKYILVLNLNHLPVPH